MTLKRDCDICKKNGNTKSAMADVKLFGGPWAYVCSTHFSMRESDKLVTMLDKVL